MKTHLNTLFVTLEDSYLRKDGAAVEVRHEGKTKLRVPLHNLDGIVCFGWDCYASAALMGACAEADVALSFHNPYGKFLAAGQGFTSGNILLRRAQYRAADDSRTTLEIARNMISAKLVNTRSVLQRANRDHGKQDDDRAKTLSSASDRISRCIRTAGEVGNLDSLRGIEGEAATYYFKAFPKLLTSNTFCFNGRNRRPPTDPVNALLSFLYNLLAHDCRSALESCGLDAQCGFLHRDRPGRPSLALDLAEEFRAFFADRATLTLLNRQQLRSSDFEIKENGAVYLHEKARKAVLNHWQERKQAEITHPLLEEKVTVGLLPHLQARLLARYLRGDLDAYPAFIAK